MVINMLFLDSTVKSFDKAIALKDAWGRYDNGNALFLKVAAEVLFEFRTIVSLNSFNGKGSNPF